MPLNETTPQVAIIAGGSGDIGRATAQRLLAKGRIVYALDQNDEALNQLKTEIPGIRTHRVDLLDEEATKIVISKIHANHDRIDILVNTVGIEGVRTSIDEHDINDWRRIIDVNVTAPVIATKHTVPFMKQRDYGRIVFLSSTAGKDGNPFFSAYSAAKAAIMALTKSVGKELATTGIRANCVTPAAIDSALFRRSSNENSEKIAIGRIPMGRLGKPDEVAALIEWLTTEDCSFSTGAVFDASGGRSTY
ncbi:SDR family NAD(P)-dependent oxidoreductase [Brucella gallinifaecis]|uniref:SDR family NAD(P)-dependent oxidoreductase n=1 Tax=Brucella gallinifaecis TaxID=215590 RepID=UPI002361A58E|nr:SDR family oxidoreductase [Brucella gallinifaecis]